LQQYSNVFYAQGYSGHGLNVTHGCARLLAEAIHAGHSQGQDIFSQVPHMTFPGGGEGIAVTAVGVGDDVVSVAGEGAVRCHIMEGASGHWVRLMAYRPMAARYEFRVVLLLGRRRLQPYRDWFRLCTCPDRGRGLHL